MKFGEFYGKGSPVISFELFPPKTDKGMEELERRLPRLIDLNPAFITVTYGAMGSTQARTLEIASLIKNRFGKETAHHLTCVGAGRDQIDRILEEIRAHNIENIVALRGDPPRGEKEFQPPPDGYRYANQLVEHIRQTRSFSIAVAGYPEKHLEAPDLETDLRNLKRKVEAGADLIITQLFFDNRLFYRFRDRLRKMKIELPVIPGLMPILNLQQIQRITQMCGASIPEPLLRELHEAAEDEARVHEIGIRHTVSQARDLLEKGVEGIHFYVLNRYFHISEIMQRLRPQLVNDA